MKILRIIAILAVLTIAAIAAVGSLIQRAPRKTITVSNPFSGNINASQAGAKLYARECASCHGGSREGGLHAPALAQPEVFDAAPGALAWVLRNGSLRRGMPSFAHLPEPMRWQIITFLQDRKAR